jgi:hypothetical protein
MPFTARLNVFCGGAITTVVCSSEELLSCSAELEEDCSEDEDFAEEDELFSDDEDLASLDEDSCFAEELLETTLDELCFSEELEVGSNMAKYAAFPETGTISGVHPTNIAFSLLGALAIYLGTSPYTRLSLCRTFSSS